jgi:hypothetical protein
MYLTLRQLNGQIAFSTKRSLDVFDLKEGVCVKSGKLILGLKTDFLAENDTFNAIFIQKQS